MKFTVYENKWLRGFKDPQGNGCSSQLENARGEKCCMGFLAEALGIPQGARADAFYFSSDAVFQHADKMPEALRPRPEGRDMRAHGRLAGEIYETNDARTISDDVRKKKLKSLFSQAGIEVEFVPGEPPTEAP